VTYNQKQMESFGRLVLEGLIKGDAEMVEGCLARGVDPNVSVPEPAGGAARPLLHWAARHFNEKCAQALLDRGANIEGRDGDGETPLFYAIRNSNVPAVDFLMKNGADPVAQNDKGVCACDIARGLRTDYDSYAKTRDKILKLLSRSAPAPARPQPDAGRDFAAATQDDIPVLKPIELQRKKGAGGAGFNL
jgi:hypothetical protein